MVEKGKEGGKGDKMDDDGWSLLMEFQEVPAGADGEGRRGEGR